MEKSSWKKRFAGACIVAGITGVLALCLLYASGGAWNLPVLYGAGDGMTPMAYIRAIQDTGWVFYSDRVGAPFGTVFADFPANLLDNFTWVIYWLLSRVLSGPALILNGYLLLTLLLCAGISYLVFRAMGVRPTISGVASVLYTFSPYILQRMVGGHISLSSAQFIPLAALVCWWCFTEDSFFMPGKGFWHHAHNRWALLFLPLITSTGIGYYAYFTCFFLVVTAIYKMLRAQRVRAGVNALLLTGGVTFCFVLNFVPLLYTARVYGTSTETVVRSLAETEFYGLKLSSLFIPINGFGISRLSQKLNLYYTINPGNENVIGYLGLAGVIGFALLLIQLVAPKFETKRGSGLHGLAVLLGAGVLLGTVGGVSTLVSLLVTDMLRCGNRISIFLLFFCLCATALCADSLLQKVHARRAANFIPLLLAVPLFCEQLAYPLWGTNAMGISMLNFEFSSETFLSDRDFVAEIERMVPENSMIFQLPVVKFPEAGQVNHMPDYAHFAGFIHSKTLRWSYGAQEGRPSGVWMDAVSRLSQEDMLTVLCATGYEGIYIDRWAYDNEAQALEEALTAVLGKPIESAAGNKSFFSLAAYKQKLQEEQGAAQMSKLSDAVLNKACFPVLRPVYTDGENNWRWFGQTTKFPIYNASEKEQPYRLFFTATAAIAQPYRVFVTANGATDTFESDEAFSAHVDTTLTLQPGINWVTVNTDAPVKKDASAGFEVCLRISDCSDAEAMLRQALQET